MAHFDLIDGNSAALEVAELSLTPVYTTPRLKKAPAHEQPRVKAQIWSTERGRGAGSWTKSSTDTINWG